METSLFQEQERSSTIVKAEPNVLRLPVFALRNKDLQKIDGYRYTGTLSRGGKTYEFTFEVARSTMAPYPGLTSRKAHQAILSILAQRGFPLENPITWSWRDLFRRMGVSPSGRTERETKIALEAIALLGLRSSQAIWSQAKQRPISTKRQVLHLYDRVVFAKDELPDGGVADTNYLWLAQWYLDNLNASYFTYLDYDLWRHLDHQNPIASRLYELSLSKFSKAAFLRINYPTFAQLLPLQPAKKYSLAQRQLSRAFAIVVKEGIYEPPRWQRRQAPTIAQIELQPGNRLAGIDQPSLLEQESIENVTVKELRSKPQPPEAKLISHFYKRWQQTQQQGRSETLIEFRTATAKELAQIRRYVAVHGLQKTKALINTAIEIMATEWPKAKTFAAVDRYIADAVQLHAGRESSKKAAAKQAQQRRREKQRADQEQRQTKQLIAQYQPVWDSLPEDEREQIKGELLEAKFPKVTDHRQQRLLLESHLFLISCLEHIKQHQLA